MIAAGALAIADRLAPSSLDLRRGELACLIGPNGGGKTSLLHALAGIGRAGGQVRIDGIDPHREPPTRRQRLIAYLPASRDIRWPLAAADLIALGLSSHAAAAIAALDLEPFLDRRIDRLSTGERSRVLIARALAAKPALLLLDEPAANLDPVWQLRLMAHLRACAAGGQALLVAMHDLELTRRFADRVILMDDRRIVADGAASQILDGPDVSRVFGIERVDGEWRAKPSPVDPRSSP